MIIDRTWIKRDNRYEISYIDKDGKRAFYQKYISHWATYEYDENGMLDTWNGKKCNKVFKDANSPSWVKSFLLSNLLDENNKL